MRCALVTGVQTCALPIWLAVALMVFSAVIVGFLQPYTRYAYRALVYTVTHTAWDTALERGTFFTGFGNKTIVVHGISQDRRQLSSLFIHHATPPQGPMTPTAQSGPLSTTPDPVRP